MSYEPISSRLPARKGPRPSAHQPGRLRSLGCPDPPRITTHSMYLFTTIALVTGGVPAVASQLHCRPSCGGVTPHSSSSSSTSPASFTAPALPAASAAAKPACRKLLAGNHLQESCTASYAAVHGRGQVGRSAAGSTRRADPGRSCLLRPGIQKAAKPLPAVGRAVLDPSSAQGLTGGKGNRSSHILSTGGLLLWRALAHTA